MTEEKKMGNLMALIAIILFFGWAIESFSDGTRGIVQALLVFGFFAFIFRFIQSEKN